MAKNLGTEADKTLDLQMIGVDGNEVTMKAVNYFGFNNGATMFDGLYASGGALTQDFATVLYRIQVTHHLPAPGRPG